MVWAIVKFATFQRGGGVDERTGSDGRGVMSAVVEKEVRCRGWLFVGSDGVLMALAVF